MTLNIMTLSIMTLIIMALSIMTLSIMTLSIMTLSIMTLSITFKKFDTPHEQHTTWILNIVMLSVASFNAVLSVVMLSAMESLPQPFPQTSQTYIKVSNILKHSSLTIYGLMTHWTIQTMNTTGTCNIST